MSSSGEEQAVTLDTLARTHNPFFVVDVFWTDDYQYGFGSGCANNLWLRPGTCPIDRPHGEGAGQEGPMGQGRSLSFGAGSGYGYAGEWSGIGDGGGEAHGLGHGNGTGATEMSSGERIAW